MSRKVTMQVIADRLQISKNSVSQALSGKSGVSEETRKLVQNAAHELGYQYPQNKKILDDTKQTRNIALIASDFAFSLKGFFGEICLSMERELREHNASLFIQSISEEADDQLDLPDFIKEKDIDGLLVLSHLSTEYIKKVIKQNIPTVLIDHHHPSIHADAILTNNRFGAYKAVQYLIELGHKDIAFVGDISHSPSYKERLDGYELALNSYNLPIKASFLLTDVKESEEIISKRISEIPSQPTAWFCVNDGLGFLISSCLQKRGVQVPNQASICSFDNGLLSRIATPKITTVNIDLDFYGRRAVKQLFWRLLNPEEPFEEILLPTELIIRESTARPFYI